MPGLDKSIIDTVAKDKIGNRITEDIKSDFILSIHQNAIFLEAFDDLSTYCLDVLSSGKYEPLLPLTMSVPKKGGFSRPGSILTPVDRFVYQLLSDSIVEVIESYSDRSRNFSNQLNSRSDSDTLFKSSSQSWDEYKNCVTKMCNTDGYLVKADVANYFERIPQHHLINLLHSSGCQSGAVNLLEKVLLAFREKNSFGIIQGLFPSDILGNFYLSDIDAYCELHNIPSARYVDDMYFKFDDFTGASKGMLQIVEHLRKYGLNLNESKSGVFTSQYVRLEETELDELFAEAKCEIEKEMTQEIIRNRGEIPFNASFIGQYGFNISWEYEEEEDIEIDEEELLDNSIERLYESIEYFPEATDKIEKFCLPILRYSLSDIAIERSLKSIIEKPYMSKIYTSYLLPFVSSDIHFTKKLENVLTDNRIISDYQYMCILAALMHSKKISKNSLNFVLRLFENKKVSIETRAIAAFFIAKYGAPPHKNNIRMAYESEPSEYVKSSILYSAKHFTNAERSTCKKAWGGHSFTNSLIAKII